MGLHYYLKAVAKVSGAENFVATFVGSGIFRLRLRQSLRQRCKNSRLPDRSFASVQPASLSPHPGPLPRGEGETFAARRRIKPARWFAMGSTAVPSPTGRGSG